MASSAPSTKGSEHYRNLARLSHQSRRINALERHIKAVVETAPPLTTEQRDRLSRLLGQAPTGEAVA